MIISGKELSAKLKAEMAAQVASFPAKYGRVPHLVVILVGDDPGSVSYVTGKAKASAEVGIRNTTIRRPDTISEEELLGMIAELNADDGVDGILVQLPLPKHRQVEGCGRLPPVECGGFVAETALYAALHTEGHNQDAKERRC